MKIFRVSVMMGLTFAVCAAVSPRANATVGIPLAVVAGVAGEAPQVKDDLFAGTEKFAQGATDVTEVNMDKNMLGMMGKHKDKGGDSDLPGKMDFIVVHSYTYDKPGMYRMEDVEVYRRKLMDGSWNCSVHVKDKDGTTDVCSRSDEHGEASEMVVMTAEPKELTFVHMRGRGLSMGDIGSYMGHKPPKAPMPPVPPLVPRAPAAPAPPAPPR